MRDNVSPFLEIAKNNLAEWSFLIAPTCVPRDLPVDTLNWFARGLRFNPFLLWKCGRRRAKSILNVLPWDNYKQTP